MDTKKGQKQSNMPINEGERVWTGEGRERGERETEKSSKIRSLLTLCMLLLAAGMGVLFVILFLVFVVGLFFVELLFGLLLD